MQQRNVIKSFKISWIFLAVGVSLVLTQFYLVIGAMKRQSELEKPLFSISALKPDKKEFKAGEFIHFTYTRRTVSERLEFPIVLLTVDSFENKDTGETYVGSIGARIIREYGDIPRSTTRVLPEYMTPGTYTLQGWARAEARRLEQGVPYESEPFEVLP